MTTDATSNDTAPILFALRTLSGETLLRFLGKQRWFAAKGASPTSARVATIVVVPWGNGAFAITRVVVSAASGDQLYQLPLAVRDSVPFGVPASAVVQPATPGSPALYDAVHDTEFRAGLSAVFAAASSIPALDGARWVVEPIDSTECTTAIDTKSKVATAEQSNTSIVFGNAAIFKLFRTLNPGIHPDAEVTRFLTTRAGFAGTPALLATTRFEDGAVSVTSGMLQAFLPDSIDAWSYALDRARPFFAAPAGRDAPNVFVEDAKRLGAITRAMHDALASDDDDPDFSPEPATPEDLDRWTDRARRSALDALALLERQLSAPAFLKSRLAEAQALVRRRDQYVSWIDDVDDTLGDDLGMQIRIHADFHLGQVLRTRDGNFAVIDFEGEPSRSLEERRAKTSPLRDVAGMLRSFAYAAATLSTSVEKTLDMPTRELRGARWERDVRTAYLSGYLGDSDDDAPDIFPEQREHVHQLIALFEAEKAFYELAYELNNRPEWAWIPMRGISKLLMKR